MAFGFAPAMVARSLPDAWSHADPHQVMVARSDAVADALRSRLPAGEGGELAELAALLWAAVDAATFDGRPLAAAWSAVPRPADPVASLWLATTVLREHRGDGHVLANVAAGVSGLEAGLLHEATGAVTREALQPNRGWTDEAWERAGAALRERGLLRDDGLLTAGGLSLRREIEATTDRLAAVPLDALGAAGVQRALELATPLAPDPDCCRGRPALSGPQSRAEAPGHEPPTDVPARCLDGAPRPCSDLPAVAAGGVHR
jgi:hypothetical protein